MTKMLINEIQETNGNIYRLWADLEPCDSPRNHWSLSFYSTWSGSKDAESVQKKFEFFMDDEAMARLGELLGDR